MIEKFFFHYKFYVKTTHCRSKYFAFWDYREYFRSIISSLDFFTSFLPFLLEQTPYIFYNLQKKKTIKNLKKFSKNFMKGLLNKDWRPSDILKCHMETKKNVQSTFQRPLHFSPVGFLKMELLSYNITQF